MIKWIEKIKKIGVREWWMKIEKKDVELIIVLVYAILLYFDLIQIERIKYLFVILIIYMTYVYIFKEIGYYYERKNEDIENKVKGLRREELKKYVELNEYFKKEEKEKKEEWNEKELKVYVERLKKELKTLIMIYNYRNYLIVILVKIKLKINFLIRRMNKIMYKQIRIRKVIIVVVEGILFTPIELILYLYYDMLKKLVEKAFTDIILRRIQGLIISILILTNIIEYIKDIIEGREYIILIVYVILCIILNYIGDTRFYELPTIHKVTSKRILATILGLIIWKKLNLLEKINEMTVIKYNIKEELVKEVKDINFINVCIAIQIMQLANRSMIRLRVISRQVVLDQILFEVKGKPPFFIYYMLYENLTLRLTGDFKGFEVELKEEKNENKKELLRFFLKKEYEMIKYILFKLWDIDKYIGYKENMYIIDELCFDIRFKGHNYVKEERKEDILYIVTNFEPFDGKWFKIENNKEEFLDFEDNFEYYVEVYNKIYHFGNDLEYKQKWTLYYAYLDHIYTEKEEMNELEKDKYKEEVGLRLGKWIEEWRKEWELGWEKGERTYLKKDL